MKRCPWPVTENMIRYHDEEWGAPQKDDRTLFEFWVLSGFQAGLSWSAILNRRSAFRRAFEDFEPQAVAGFEEVKIASLLQDAAIIRNRQKITAAVQNARIVLEIQALHGSFAHYLWQFTGGAVISNAWTAMQQIPAISVESQCMSQEMKKVGFRFAGPTICYAFMQSVGMVNDHLVDCFRYAELTRLTQKE